MATVYKAKDIVLNRFVAVKILREEYTTDDEFIKRFNIEAQAAASLTDHNIVSIYDVGNEGNLYYIVMELIKGKTLKEIIIEDGSLPWKWSINVAIQIAMALETAHKNNIIHRDIKPHNIIITEEGVAKVTDFGIAKAISNATITAFGTTIGSVHYFSPEHARGGYTDAKSDIYSLGVVMYEMLTGRVPFDSDTPVSVALKHMQEEPLEPIKIKPTIPINVNNIIMKAMQKDPLLRYSTATQMLEDLNSVLKNPEETINIGQKTMVQPTQRVNVIEGITGNKKKQNKMVAFFNRHKILRAFTVLMLAVLLFILTMFITFKVIDSKKLKDVQIINLTGMSVEEAAKELEKIKVKLDSTEEEFDLEVPAGFIISQEPKYKENYTIKQNSTIKVIVSKGKEIVEVPKISGKPKEEALEELRKVGLVPEVIEEENKTVEAGYVFKQDPEAGKEADGKSTVKVYISKGVKKVKVPNLIGKTEAEARVAITEAGLTLETVRYEEDTTKTNGQVIKQTIDAGTEVEDKTSIVITVNNLPEIKSGTVYINLKSILNYTEEKDVNNIPIEPGEVKVTVKVTSVGVEETVYSSKHKKNTTNIQVPIKGIGTVTVKVFIDDVLGSRTYQLNLNNTSTLNVE